MRFRKVLALRGPNVWARFPVLEAWVEMAELKDVSSTDLPGLNARLEAWLPSLVEHRCVVGVRGGFLDQLSQGIQPAHVLMHLALELQELAGSPVIYGRTRATTEDGVYRVVVEYHEEQLAKAAMASAAELFQAAIDDRPFDVPATVGTLRDLLLESKLGPSTGSIVEAARKRGIAVRRLSKGSMVQLGWGSKQRRICAAETDRTSAIAEAIAQDKDITRDVLSSAGVPVPRGLVVVSEDEAWEEAQELGLPVVVKPQYGNQGKGVATNLTTEAQIRAAYRAAIAIPTDIAQGVIVEQFAPGDDYRLLIVGGRLIAAARREPAQVHGDGIQTIAELVAEVNRDPRRGEDHNNVLSAIHLDDPISLAVLADQGYTVASIPPAGQRVLIRRNANLSTGGTATDVTDQVHPEVAARAIEAARTIGLDIAGVDVVAQDLGRPLEDQGGVIVEVNACPGLRMHLEPSYGTPQPVGEAIIDMMFGPGEAARIPIVAVTGVNGKTTATRLIAHMIRSEGRRVGMTCTDGVYLDCRRIDTGDCSGPGSAQLVLGNPMVEAAVLETARGGILRAGLGFDRCDVAVITNIGEGDHLGLADIETPEELARVKQVLVKAVAPTGTAVLNATDPLTVAMAPLCEGRVLFFARSEAEPALVAHRQSGGCAAFVRDGEIILAEGDRELTVAPLAEVPITFGGRVGFQVENALAASAAAWAAGVPIDSIRAALASFECDMARTPGRFNVLELGTATLILDYGHNPSAVAALIEAVNQFSHTTRTIAFSAAGDRRDQDIIRQGELIGAAFDQVILFEDCNRGRSEGEVLGLLRQGVERGGKAKIIEAGGERDGIGMALRMLQPGELLLAQPDDIDGTLAFVQQYLAENPKTGRTPRPVSTTTTTPAKAPATAGLFATQALKPDC